MVLQTIKLQTKRLTTSTINYPLRSKKLQLIFLQSHRSAGWSVA